MKHQLYGLYKKKTKEGKVWYVRFWNTREQRYTITRSTEVPVVGKKGKFREADEVARKILETLYYNPTKKTVIQYLTDYWKIDSSYFVELKKIKKKPVTNGYITKMKGIIKNHIAIYPEFQKLPIVELTSGSIKDWMIWLSNRGRSNQIIDKALLAIKGPIKEAVAREELKHDPTDYLIQPVFTYHEKGILKPPEVKLLIEEMTERDMRLAVLLGMLCGMRVGEVRGLRYEDIQNSTIMIKNNYQDSEGGDKNPKNNSFRSVFLPDIIEASIGIGSGYLFKNRNKKSKGKPNCYGYFRNLFIEAAKLIGISLEEQITRNLTFHSLRHTFITFGRAAGIPDIMVDALAGHKSRPETEKHPSPLRERYTHAGQIINLEEVQEKFKMVIGL